MIVISYDDFCHLIKNEIISEGKAKEILSAIKSLSPIALLSLNSDSWEVASMLVAFKKYNVDAIIYRKWAGTWIIQRGAANKIRQIDSSIDDLESGLNYLCREYSTNPEDTWVISNVEPTQHRVKFCLIKDFFCSRHPVYSHG